MAIEIQTVDDLAVRLQEGGYRRIGIDGFTGCGKSTLAMDLSTSLDFDLLSIDDYLDQNQGKYLDHLRLEDLQKVYESQFGGCIIEGVCLLQVLEAAQLGIDVLIYIKRMHREIWADERECDVNPENVNHAIGEMGGLVTLFSTMEVDNPGELKAGLPKLVEEISLYHASYRPIDNANFFYLRNEE